MKKNIINNTGAPLSLQTGKTANKKASLQEFYEGFKDGVHEVKLSLDGKVELKDAKTWLTRI